MHIWIVCASIDYEGESVLGAFSSFELAEKFINKAKSKNQSVDNYVIRSFELDSPPKYPWYEINDFTEVKSFKEVKNDSI